MGKPDFPRILLPSFGRSNNANTFVASNRATAFLRLQIPCFIFSLSLRGNSRHASRFYKQIPPLRQCAARDTIHSFTPLPPILVKKV